MNKMAKSTMLWYLCLVGAILVMVACNKDLGGTVIVQSISGSSGGDASTLDMNDSYFYTRSGLWYGDGSDGDVNLSGTVTLVRNMYYKNLFINTSAVVKPSSFLIFVNETLYLRGKIVRSGTCGNPGLSQNPGTGGAICDTGNGILSTGVAGAQGGTGNTGTGGNAAGTVGISLCQIANGNAGGNGGAGSAGGGGNKGAVGSCTTIYPTILFQYMAERTNIMPYGSTGSSGGGGGGGDGVNRGGGGGGGGSPGCEVYVSARNIVMYATGRIEAAGGCGGNAGNGAVGNTGGGGGGGGANGALVRVAYERTVPSPIDSYVNISGGQAGIRGTKQGTGTDGMNGTHGTDGICLFYDTEKNMVRRGSCRTLVIPTQPPPP